MTAEILEKVFRLREHNTTIRTEVVAGITTFMTMAYILAVNPLILSQPEWTGMPYLQPPPCHHLLP